MSIYIRVRGVVTTAWQNHCRHLRDMKSDVLLLKCKQKSRVPMDICTAARSFPLLLTLPKSPYFRKGF